MNGLFLLVWIGVAVPTVLCGRVLAQGDNTASSMRSHFSSSENDPIPVPFPNSFQIDFVTNITWPVVEQQQETNPKIGNGQDRGLASSNSSWISGRLYYDWTNKMQRIDHGPGSYECVHFYHYDGPCYLVFIPDYGMYRILLPKAPRGDEIDILNGVPESTPMLDCCLDIPNIGTPPPSWAEQGYPTYNGIIQDSFSKLSAFEWIYDHVGEQEINAFRNAARSSSFHPLEKNHTEFPAEQYHTTRQVIDGEFAGRPVLFTFPSAGGVQDYHYLVDTMKELDATDPSIFSLPDGCQIQFCKCDVRDLCESQTR